jgi:hypothetical protein
MTEPPSGEPFVICNLSSVIKIGSSQTETTLSRFENRQNLRAENIHTKVSPVLKTTP